jgi:dipeptidyl aminopeptidase/acylaminoacyl peptidase
MRTRRSRLAAAGLATVLSLGVVGYAGAGLFVLNTGTSLPGGCHQEHASFTPASWTNQTWVSGDWTTSLDARPYWMPDYQSVSFPSRDRALTIDAWLIPAAAADAPVVIAVHGQGSCKRDPAIVMPAGMLHRQGFGVLMIDLRDSGSSSTEDGRYGAGSDEYRDVLGAWDWLVSRGVAPARIGLFGQSGGGAAVTIAMGEEPRLAAAWEESGFMDMQTMVKEELRRMGYPEVLAPAASLWAKAFGDDFATLSPIAGVAKIGSRPFQIVHGTNDLRVNVHHATDAAAVQQRASPAAVAWLIPGGGHVQGPFLVPSEYETRLGDFFGSALGA